MEIIIFLFILFMNCECDSFSIIQLSFRSFVDLSCENLFFFFHFVSRSKTIFKCLLFNYELSSSVKHCFPIRYFRFCMFPRCEDTNHIHTHTQNIQTVFNVISLITFLNYSMSMLIVLCSKNFFDFISVAFESSSFLYLACPWYIESWDSAVQTRIVEKNTAEKYFTRFRFEHLFFLQWIIKNHLCDEDRTFFLYFSLINRFHFYAERMCLFIFNLKKGKMKENDEKESVGVMTF